MNNNLMEWSRNVVNSIMNMHNDHKYVYFLKFIIEPNPLNFDGMDEITIEIIKKENNSKSRENLFYKTDYCVSVDEALVQIEEFVELLTKKE